MKAINDKVMQAVVKAQNSEEGQGLVEYGLIIFLVSIACVIVLGLLGTQVAATFQSITGSLGG